MDYPFVTTVSVLAKTNEFMQDRYDLQNIYKLGANLHCPVMLFHQAVKRVMPCFFSLVHTTCSDIHHFTNSL